MITLFFIHHSFILSSCCAKKRTPSHNSTVIEPKRDFEKEGYTKAIVIFYEVDACKYILRLEPDLNGPDVIKQLEPSNLKEEFKKDQLAVWIKYTPNKGGVSTCMAGQMVDLTDIQLRD